MEPLLVERRQYPRWELLPQCCFGLFFVRCPNFPLMFTNFRAPFFSKRCFPPDLSTRPSLFFRFFILIDCATARSYLPTILLNVRLQFEGKSWVWRRGNWDRWRKNRKLPGKRTSKRVCMSTTAKNQTKKRTRQSISNIYMRFYEIPRACLPRAPFWTNMIFFQIRIGQKNAIKKKSDFYGNNPFFLVFHYRCWP